MPIKFNAFLIRWLHEFCKNDLAKRTTRIECVKRITRDKCQRGPVRGVGERSQTRVHCLMTCDAIDNGFTIASLDMHLIVGDQVPQELKMCVPAQIKALVPRLTGLDGFREPQKLELRR